MNPRPKSGHAYNRGDSCSRTTCHRKARYGYRGLCEFHFGARQRELVNSGELLALGARVDAGPVVARLKELRSVLSMRAIAQLSGVSVMTLHRIGRQSQVSADTAARVMGVEG